MAEEKAEIQEKEEEPQIKTKITWEYIILEELRTINRLIINAGQTFFLRNILMLREAVDSWEQSLAPIIELGENKQEIEKANREVEETMKKLEKDWTRENYSRAIEALIKKKGAIIKILAKSGKYMPISTYLVERTKKAEVIEVREIKQEENLNPEIPLVEETDSPTEE